MSELLVNGEPPQGSWGSEQAVSRWLAGKVSDD